MQIRRAAILILIALMAVVTVFAYLHSSPPHRNLPDIHASDKMTSE
ncbi:MAG: hypothetical protein JWQ02_3785 [Capsulimonas sp.]|nr:hypothetical protein [Capsulimonas sp.]